MKFRRKAADEPVVQEIPGPVMVPAPAPGSVTESPYWAGWNVAVTYFASVIETVHALPEYELQPVQLLNIQPLSGVAVSVTVAPFATPAVQPSGVTAEQARPPPEIEPLPFRVPVSV